MRVLVTGSTAWTDRKALRRELAALPAGSVIVTGDTPGIDMLAIAVAEELGHGVEAMKKSRADRKACPDASWMGLDARMLATGIDLVQAFHPDHEKPGCARGTRHMVELSRAAGVETRVPALSPTAVAAARRHPATEGAALRSRQAGAPLSRPRIPAPSTAACDPGVPRCR